MPLLYEPIWKSRHQAQIKIINELIVSIESNPLAEWQTRIKATLLALEEWSNDQFDFFVEGFNDRVLVGSRNYPAEYALRQTVEQTAHDISVLQRAHTQRLANNSLEILTRADKLAYMALKPAIDAALLNEATTVITYFQKEPNVRVTPYANLALIGIPYTCADIENNARDFLAIPHEAGHYVYSHGKMLFNDSVNSPTLLALINEEVTPYPSWYTIWIEEIFADIYTTLVAGPASVLSMLHMLFDNLDLMDDQGSHPVPVIRPETHFKALQRMKVKSVAANQPEPFSPELIDDLKHHMEYLQGLRLGWQKIRIGERFIIRAQAPEAQYAEREMVTQYLRQTGEDILKVLDNSLPQLMANNWGKESGVTKIGDVYPNFEHNILKNDSFLDQAQLSIIEGQFKLTHHRDWFDKLKVISSESNLTLQPNVWTPLLRDGWLSNGPEDDAGSK